MPWQHPEGAALAAEVQAAAAAWVEDGKALADDGFNELALAIFAFQYRHVAAYGRYCRGLNRSPGDVKDWRQIPPVPVPVFKSMPIVCQDASTCEAVFRTSGTTRGERSRGVHYMVSTALYDTVLAAGFRRIVRPAVSPPPRVLVLHPSPQARPDSSLAYYFQTLAVTFGSKVTWGLGAEGLDTAVVLGELAEADGRAQPLWLFSTTSALAHLITWLASAGEAFQLAPGSLVLETGGYKGQARLMGPMELRQRTARALGMPQRWIVNQYGMTELTSQFYDAVALPEASSGVRVKVGPPWMRVQVVDPRNLAPVPAGEVGLVQIHDLANVGSAAAVLTADQGALRPEVRLADGWPGWTQGFDLQGRAEGAAARGCSLAAADLLEATRRPDSP